MVFLIQPEKNRFAHNFYKFSYSKMYHKYVFFSYLSHKMIMSHYIPSLHKRIWKFNEVMSLPHHLDTKHLHCPCFPVY